MKLKRIFVVNHILIAINHLNWLKRSEFGSLLVISRMKERKNVTPNNHVVQCFLMFERTARMRAQ